jgi:hypothetical protein
LFATATTIVTAYKTHLTVGFEKNETRKNQEAKKPRNQMKVCSLSDLGLLTEEEREIAECSNRVYVPGALFTQLLRTSVVTLRLRNAVEQTVYGRMFAAHMANRETVYVPQWMCEALDCDLEMCHVSPVDLPRCTAITLQPFNEEDVEEMDLLQSALERYTVVSPGQEITLWHPYGYPYAIRVASVAPDTAVVIEGCEIPLNMLPPVVATATVEPSVATATVEPSVATATAATATTDLRRQCYEAAMRRMEAKEKPE